MHERVDLRRVGGGDQLRHALLALRRPAIHVERAHGRSRSIVGIAVGAGRVPARRRRLARPSLLSAAAFRGLPSGDADGMSAALVQRRRENVAERVTHVECSGLRHRSVTTWLRWRDLATQYICHDAVSRLRRSPRVVVAIVSRCSGLAAAPPSRTRRRAPSFCSAAPDSTFWVATTRRQRIARRAAHARALRRPLLRALHRRRRHSYDDALLVGERLYRRDLVTGDSAVVFADTTVRRIAAAYAARIRTSGRSVRTKRASRSRDVGDRRDRHPRRVRSVPVVRVSRRRRFARARALARDAARRARPSDRQATRRCRPLRRLGARAIVASGARRVSRSMRDFGSRARPSLRPDERRAADALARRQFDERSFALVDDRWQAGGHVRRPGRGEGRGRERRRARADHRRFGDPGGGTFAPPVPTHRRRRQRSLGSDRAIAVIARYDTSGEIARVFARRLDAARVAARDDARLRCAASTGSTIRRSSDRRPRRALDRRIRRPPRRTIANCARVRPRVAGVARPSVTRPRRTYAPRPKPSAKASTKRPSS